MSALAGGTKAFRRYLNGRRCGRAVHEAQTAAAAKLAFGGVHSPAAEALEGECSATMGAKAPVVRIVFLAAQAFHDGYRRRRTIDCIGVSATFAQT